MQIYTIANLPEDNGGITSPLYNVFTTEDNELPRYDVRKANEVIDSYERALDDLQQSQTSTVHLKSGKGKTSFAMHIAQQLPDDFVVVSFQGNVKDGAVDVQQAINSIESKIGVDRNQIIILVEAQVLSEEQKRELESNFGKIIYLENERNSKTTK